MPGPVTFSKRHLEVIAMIGSGRAEKTTARLLGIGHGTVKTHVKLIGAKLESIYPTYAPRERIILYFREYLLRAITP